MRVGKEAELSAPPRQDDAGSLAAVANAIVQADPVEKVVAALHLQPVLKPAD